MIWVITYPSTAFVFEWEWELQLSLNSTKKFTSEHGKNFMAEIIKITINDILLHISCLLLPLSEQTNLFIYVICIVFSLRKEY